MRKLSLMWIALFAITGAAMAVGGEGCGDSGSSGGGGPGGAGGSNTNPTSGGTNTNPSTGGSTSSSPSTGGSSQGGSSQGGGGAAGTGGSGGTGGAACAGIELTVIDALAWCTVTVGNNAPVVSSNQTVCVDASSTVSLKATANANFMVEKGIWHDTDDDTAGPSHGGSEVDTAITVGASGKACVWVCCPGDAQHAGLTCPNTDQCP